MPFFQVCPAVDGPITSDRDLISGFRSHVFSRFYSSIGACVSHYYLLITIFRVSSRSDEVPTSLAWAIVSNNEWLNALARIAARLRLRVWVKSKFIVFRYYNCDRFGGAPHRPNDARIWNGVKKRELYLLWANVPFIVCLYQWFNDTSNHTVQMAKRLTRSRAHMMQLAFEIAIKTNWNWFFRIVGSESGPRPVWTQRCALRGYGNWVENRVTKTSRWSRRPRYDLRSIWNW